MEELLGWMNENPSLSGWAQTVGALLALLVALAVPWMQHVAQARREQLLELERNIYLSHATMLLLRDALNFSERVRQSSHLPKDEINDPVLVIDLLERLRALDTKDSSVPRQASQYVVRAAVLRINHFLDSVDVRSRELSPQVLEVFKTDAFYMESEFSKLRFLLDEFLYQQTRLNVSIWKRPWVWYGFRTEAGRRWLNESCLKRKEELKKKCSRRVCD